MLGIDDGKDMGDLGMAEKCGNCPGQDRNSCKGAILFWRRIAIQTRTLTFSRGNDDDGYGF